MINPKFRGYSWRIRKQEENGENTQDGKEKGAIPCLQSVWGSLGVDGTILYLILVVFLCMYAFVRIHMSDAKMAGLILNYSSSKKTSFLLKCVVGTYVCLLYLFIVFINSVYSKKWFLKSLHFPQVRIQLSVADGTFPVLAPVLPTCSELPLLLLSQGYPSCMVGVHGPVFHWAKSCLSRIHPV